MSENQPVQHPLPAGVHDTFMSTCNDCGGTISVVCSTRQPHTCGPVTARHVLNGIRARLDAANPLGSDWVPLTDPGDRNNPPAWIVDADDLEVRLDATYASGKVATFIAAAPTDVACLAKALEAIMGIQDIGMDKENGDPSFISGWEAALEEVQARIDYALKEDTHDHCPDDNPAD